MIAPDEAVAAILTHVSLLHTEKVHFTNSLNRICAQDIISPVNIPYHNNSAMDGYACKAADTAHAADNNPASLAVIGEYQAGVIRTHARLGNGQAVRIMTGAPIPPGADTVVEKEAASENGNVVMIFRSAEKNENIRSAGEDIAHGDCVVKKGTRITAAAIGLLASIGADMITVFRRPTVAVIATGDEIAEPGTPLQEGIVINSNSYALMALIGEYNGTPRYIGIARDTVQSCKAAIEQVLSADVIISSGGVSEGSYDFIITALVEMGFELIVERIAMKPGKPCVFARRGNTLYFGLPGNPVSSIVSFIQFVRPAMLAMQGADKLKKPVMTAVCRETLKRKNDGRTLYIRGILAFDGSEPTVRTTGSQGSGILRSMAEANCLIIIPPDMSIVNEGDSVPVQLIYHPEI